MNINKFLESIYSLIAQAKIDEALDTIFGFFNDLRDQFSIMNEILIKLDVDKLNEDILVGFLVQTFKYVAKVPEHLSFCDRAELRLTQLGLSNKEAQNLVGLYRVQGWL